MTTVVHIRSLTQTLWAEVAAVGEWWLRELRSSYASLASRLRSKNANALTFEFQGDALVVYSDNRQDPSARTVALTNNAFPNLEDIFDRDVPQHAHVTIVLTAKNVLIRRLKLPRLSALEIDNAIELQLERELPITRTAVSVDWQTTLDEANNTIEVCIAIARVDFLERLRQWIESQGWQIARVTADTGFADRKLDLLPRRNRALDWSLRPRDRWFAGSLLVLLAFCEAMVVVQWWWERRQLEPLLTEARAQIVRFEKQRGILRAEAAPLLALKPIYNTPSVAEILDAMSASIPADTWIYQAEIDNRQDVHLGASIKLNGYAPSGATLSETLGKNANLSDVELLRASAGAQPGVEQVEIIARWHPLPGAAP